VGVSLVVRMHFPSPPPSRIAAPKPVPRPSRHVAPPRQHQQKKRWGLRIALTLGFCSLVGGAAFAARCRFLPVAAVLPGVRVDGQLVAAGATEALLRATIDERAKHLLAHPVALALPGGDKPVFEGSLADLGVRVDTARTASAVLRFGKEGDLITRGEAAEQARRGEIDVPLVVAVDRDVAMARLLSLKEVEDTSPVSARLDLDKHETVPEKDGRYIDADETIALLEERLRGMSFQEPKLTLPLSVKAFPPRISSSFLKSLEIGTVVAEYETYFSRGGDQQRRGKNIDNAAQKLDGLVISPGELLSFNEVIGERSESNGFEKSWEIFKGEMVEGVGGGTCQVASTFHAATFFAGFDVLERLPHSRPSAYIPMGLDSTVVYPAVDLKVRNPHPFPVVVHAKTVGNKLRVELLGKTRPVRVEFGREILSTLPYKRKIEEDPTVAGRKVLVKQHGIKGYKIKISRLFTYADGRKKKEEVTDTYPPTVEIYKVPVGFDVAQLPPLPDGDANAEDADLGGNPSAAPPSARTPAAAGTDSVAASAPNSEQPPASDIEFVDAPGAHAPTAAQRDAAKTVWLRR
jgi:vancomycin resistance protein YoaR